MSRVLSGELKDEFDLNEHAISELIEFFSLLDKWDREAKGEVVEHDAMQGTSREQRDSSGV